MLMKNKRGGIGKIIIWIILILVIIGLIALAFNYLGNNDESSSQNGNQEQNSDGQASQINNFIDDGNLGEKPPTPPE